MLNVLELDICNYFKHQTYLYFEFDIDVTPVILFMEQILF